MAIQPVRFTVTVTDFGRKAIVDVKRGKIKVNGSRITIKFPENVTHKPKR